MSITRYHIINKITTKMNEMNIEFVLNGGVLICGWFNIYINNKKKIYEKIA